MAKDPATLWYWNDWHSGTILMSRFLKGCYIDILHAQFNHGPLSLEEIKTCLGSDFGSSWPTIQKKFTQTEMGLFFNERLEQEKQKRIKFCISRRKNRESKTHDPTYDKHMIPHMENENENRNGTVFKEGGMGETVYTIEHCAVVALNDERWVKANNADEKKLLEFNAFLEKQGVYVKNPKDYKRYFHNWTKKQKDGTHQQTFRKSGGKSEGAEQVAENLAAFIAAGSSRNQNEI